MKKLIIAGFALAALALAASSAFGAAPAKPKVGLSFGDFATERWPREKDELKKRLEAMGCEVMFSEANHDAKLQNDQLDSLAAKGCRAIIVVAEDGEACALAVERLAKKGVKVVAYDRMIMSDKVAAFVSFSYLEVGRQQGRGLLALRPAGNYVLLGGAPDNWAAMAFRAGQMEVLQPRIDAGDIKVVADEWVPYWDPARAKELMQGIVRKLEGAAIDAVVASNDGLALGALEALREAGLAGKVAVSGQDATAAGCASIVRGELSFTVLKDVRLLSDQAAELADALARGKAVQGLAMESIAALTYEPRWMGEVPCLWLPCVIVDRQNMDQLVIDSGFQSREDVYGEE